MSCEIKITWGCLFQKDGLDVESMKKYFSNNNVEVLDTLYDKVTVFDETIGAEKEVDACLFVLCNDGMFIPFKCREELMLEKIQDYIYAPMIT